MGSRPFFSSFPGFDRLYLLGEPGASRAFRANLELSTTDEAFAVTRHELQPDEPVTAKWFMGAKLPGDVIWTGFEAPLLISDRVAELLEKLGARGWSTYKIQLLGKRGESINGYSGLSVHGRCGPIDNSKSVETSRQYPVGVFPVWKGLYFDPETWDGSHVFMPAGRAGWIFVVDEVKHALEKAKVKNISFKRLDEIERSRVEMSVSVNA
jgi:hypothetical protein